MFSSCVITHFHAILKSLADGQLDNNAFSHKKINRQEMEALKGSEIELFMKNATWTIWRTSLICNLEVQNIFFPWLVMSVTVGFCELIEAL